VIPGDADHLFRGDTDQLITMRRHGDRDHPECFPQGGVALDITEGKLFLLFDLRETGQPPKEPGALSHF